MDIFSKTKQLTRLVWILGLTNLLALAFMAWLFINGKHDAGRRPSPGKKDLSALLKEELGLSASQVEQLKAIRSDFFSKEQLLSEMTRLKRDSMNSMMFRKEVDEQHLLTLARDVSANEYQMELLRVEQAKQLRYICSPEQMLKMEKLVREVRDYLKPSDK